MIELHTLGDAMIKVGDREIRPTSPMLFAALLYLCVERGRRVPRTALQELLFPEADERSGAHSLRQLLYKLRRLGVPLTADGLDILLPVDVPIAFDADVIDSQHRDALLSLRAGVLPGVTAYFSHSFGEWLEAFRSYVSRRVRTELGALLATARTTGDSKESSRIAEVILQLDPLNEDATLALAESLALAGHTQDALRLLDGYCAEVGLEPLQVSALVLRRRIHDRLSVHPAPRVPLMGREAELSWLLCLSDTAVAAGPTMAVVWGSAGIGKSRLVEEFRNALTLRNWHIHGLQCSQHDATRPLAGILDLLPELLKLPGALGVSPRSYTILRDAVAGPPQDTPQEQSGSATGSALQRALADLVISVAAETPLTLVVDNAQWLDPASKDLLLGLREVTAPFLVLLTYRGRPQLPPQLLRAIHSRHLEPLTDSAAACLLQHFLGYRRGVPDDLMQQCLTLAAGNPLFIRSVGEHLRLGGAAPPVQSGLGDLFRERIRLLEPPSLLLLRSIASGQPYATVARLREWTTLSDNALLLALQDLSDKGLIARQGQQLLCLHELLADVVQRDLPQSLRLALSERIADQMEREGCATSQPQLLWHSAEHWRVSGADTRVTQSLTLCGKMALRLGQPLLALSAFQKARALAGAGQLSDILVNTARAAELAHDDKTVIRTVTDLAPFSSTLSRSEFHSLKLAEIIARRRLGEATSHFHRDLRDIALDGDTPAYLRITAARMFMASAEQHLLFQEAASLFAAVEHEESLRADQVDWRHMTMQFHMAFGDMRTAMADAIAISLETQKHPRADSYNLLANAGLTLVKSGAVSQGFDVLRDLYRDALDQAAPLLLLDVTIKLAACSLFADDHLSFRKWHAESTKLLISMERPGWPAAYLANELDRTLIDGDSDGASATLVMLRKATECRKPYHHRFAVAYTAIVTERWGDAKELPDLLPELQEFDERGRIACDHDLLAYALFRVTRRIGSTRAARDRLIEYLNSWRRELFPPPRYLRHLLDSAQLTNVRP